VITVADDVVDFELVGGLLYLARGEAGAQVWNVDENPPRKLAEIPVDEGHSPYMGIHQYDGGFIVRSGRWIYGFDGAAAQLGSEYRAADEVRDLIRLDDSIIVLALYARGIEIVDMAGGLFPDRVGRVDTLGRAERLARVEDTLLVADGLLGVSVISLAELDAPILAELTVRTEGRVDRISANGRRAVMTESGAGLGVLDVRNGEARRLGTQAFQGESLDIKLMDPSTMAAITLDQGIVFFDLSQPNAITEWTRITLEPGIKKVGRWRDGILVIRADNRVVKLTLPCGVEGDPLTIDIDASVPDGGSDSGVDASTD
jgi:hypothetical protein